MFKADRFHAIIRGEAPGPTAYAAQAALWWLRFPYAAGIWARNRAFDHGWKTAVRVPVPVVSVGNLSLGGTGKTPCVEAVARFYRSLHLATAILSRGYGSAAGPNDEAMVLEENLPDVPHLQGRDRVELALTAVQELESEVLVLDDGFQHRRMARDLDIVLLDATRPVREEYVFPRGLLREPVGELQRADVLVLTRCDQAGPESVERQRDWLTRRFPGKPIATAMHAPLDLIGEGTDPTPIADLQGKTVGAFCGLGNPGAFRHTLGVLGATVAAFRTFPDHHSYSRADVEDLRVWAGTLPAEARIITTQKDLVKLRIPELAGRPLRALRIGMQFLEGEAALQERLRLAVKCLRTAE